MRKSTIITTLGATVIVAAAGVGATVIATGSHPAAAAAVAAPAHPSPAKTKTIHKTIVVPGPAQAAPAAPAVPSGLSYAGQGPNGGVYANSVTSAPFAVSVADAYAGGGGSDYETVYSTATGQSYGMSYANVGNNTIEATGGNGVLVQFSL